MQNEKIMSVLMQVTTSMEKILEKLSAAKINHPIIVLLGSRVDINQIFIVVEGKATYIPKGIVSGVDKIMKIYYTLDMVYPAECQHILHFLQRVVFNIADELDLCRGASDLSLFSKSNLKK